jgi:hypothetical protein
VRTTAGGAVCGDDNADCQATGADTILIDGLVLVAYALGVFDNNCD